MTTEKKVPKEGSIYLLPSKEEDVSPAVIVSDDGEVALGRVSHDPEASGTPLALTPQSNGSFRFRTLATEQGPAQVASPAYRDNYDRIFGQKRKTNDNKTLN